MLSDLRSRNAQAKSFVEKMSLQYDTVIGERGVGLSGGQKQRITIARALAKKDPVLVMDDSTSALDMETEQNIHETLQSLSDTTKIIIGHGSVLSVMPMKLSSWKMAVLPSVVPTSLCLPGKDCIIKHILPSMDKTQN